MNRLSTVFLIIFNCDKNRSNKFPHYSDHYTIVLRDCQLLFIQSRYLLLFYRYLNNCTYVSRRVQHDVEREAFHRLDSGMVRRGQAK